MAVSIPYEQSRPITFEEFVETFCDNSADVELLDGVVVERTMVQLEHEKLQMWLAQLIGVFVEKRDLGILLGSRTAVEISPFRGRLPDLLFVRNERRDIVRQKAVHGAPDLIIEIVSPTDRPSDIFRLEADYNGPGNSDTKRDANTLDH